MLAEEKSTQVLVHCYLRDRDTYLVHEIPKELKTSSIVSRNSAVALDDMADTLLLREVSVSQLISVAPSAKFYPLFETLIQRADQTAAAARSILRSATTKRLIDSTGKAIQTNVLDRISVSTESSSSSSVIDTISPANLVNVVEKAAPGIEENFKQVMTMVKDEELTVLLQKCKGRLEQLASIDVSETTRLALEKTGIIIHMDTDDLSLTKSVEESRKVALTAIQQLLQLGQLGDLSEVKSDLTQQFTEAFDSLSKVAKSDRGLHDAFSSIAEKTAVWQEATGRLMRTRSAGLFLEGASRIQARAAEIFSRDQLLAAGEIGSKLTKSFTEGDAALSRLKSIELGEAVKTRLIEAIEIRSDSLGGLDGIIAGALSTGTGVVGGITGDNLQSLFIQLQKCASSATVDAHETLLSVLSSQSSYRDMAFLRIEQVVCDLGNQIGEDLSPDEIASIVQGEGGTSKIFAPIARRAMKQIEKQLDAAELQVKDSTVLEVLKRIRKLMSGKLTVNAILDDLVNVLNDDKIVAAGESIVQQSEQVLDAIEGVSANSAVTNVFQLAEKAGITKETVMREFEKLNMDTLLGAAQNAATDDKARQQLLSAATDTALDFVLRILPSMPVPAFEGVKDGLVYHISNLSMEGFRVRKEDIQLELAGMRATRMTNAGSSHGSDVSQNGMNFEEISSSVKATELLIIDIRNTSAVLENAAWSFEQTYLPYLKGGGNAHVKMSGGSIRLQFELRKRRKDNANKKSEEQEWEPVLCLHDRSCSISDVDLILEGDGKITWILNKIAAVFKVPLRDFVVSTIVKVLTSRSGWILERLNKVLSPYWDLVLRTSQLNLVSILFIKSLNKFVPDV